MITERRLVRINISGIFMTFCVLKTFGIDRICNQCQQAGCYFIHDALPFNLMGMNATLMSQYIRFCADRVLRELKQPTIYNVTNPFPWMDTIFLQGKTNFFEKRVSEYAKVESILQATLSTTYSLLMNSSKACYKFHLSIHLFIYVTQTCTRGHGPRTWLVLFFLAILTARRYLYVMQAL
jgi:hypothetical protein